MQWNSREGQGRDLLGADERLAGEIGIPHRAIDRIRLRLRLDNFLLVKGSLPRVGRGKSAPGP